MQLDAPFNSPTGNGFQSSWNSMLRNWKQVGFLFEPAI
jgi:hypothetical protein